MNCNLYNFIIAFKYIKKVIYGCIKNGKYKKVV